MPSPSALSALSGANCSTMSSCLARAIFCASSRSTPASTTSLGHTRASGRNSLCLECPRLTVVSWHSKSSMACITTTEGRRDTHGVVWIEKVASTTVRERAARLLVIDGMRSMRDLWQDEGRLREFFYELRTGLAAVDCVGLFTTEYGVEKLMDLPEATTLDAILSLTIKRHGARRF